MLRLLTTRGLLDAVSSSRIVVSTIRRLMEFVFYSEKNATMHVVIRSPPLARLEDRRLGCIVVVVVGDGGRSEERAV